jgi:hypothetical protein
MGSYWKNEGKKKFVTTRNPGFKCPDCGAHLDAATGTRKFGSVGDISVCKYCYCAMIVTCSDPLTVRLTTKEDIDAIPGFREVYAKLVPSLAHVRNGKWFLEAIGMQDMG